MKTFDVEVAQTIRVTLDDTKFDATFMREFRESFFRYTTLEQHAAHIAQLFARGVIETGCSGEDFIEGYGPAHEMGIDAVALHQSSEVIP